MTDFPTQLKRRGFETDRLEDLVIEAVDEQTLRESRERTVARMRLLWANRRFLAQATIGGLIVAAVIAFLIPNRYEAAARLMPPDNASGMATAMLAALSSRVGEGIASAAQGTLGLKTTGDLFVGILKSDAVQDDLINKFNLQKLYRDKYIEDAREDLASHTHISEDDKSGIIEVIVTDRDRKRAVAMAQAYVDKLNWVVTSLSTSSSHRERVFLDQRLEQVKSDLESAEKQFSEFASQKGALDIPTEGKAMVQSAAVLQGQLIAAESELQSLRQIYTDNNARVRSIQARVNELNGALEKMGGASAKDTSSAQQLFPSLRELPLLGVTYADLLRRAKVEEVVFETLTKQDELAKVEEVKEIPSVKVLDSPQMPQKQSFPPRVLITILGATLALVAGAGWILTRRAWEAVNPTDPRKSLAIEVWSDVRRSLPSISKNGSAGGLAQESADQSKRAPGNEEQDESESGRGN